MDNKTRLAQMQEVRSHPKTERKSKEQIMNMITVDQETLMRMIAQAVEAEREACAKVCDEVNREYDGEEVSASWVATAIRARGNT
jgi:hypothetical protein